MNSTLIGEGTLRLGWTEVRGRYGLGSTLAIKGTLIATGYRPGALLFVTIEVSAWELAKGHHAFLGTTTPLPVVIGYVATGQWVIEHPPPDNERTADPEVLLRLEPSVLDGLEECRQGRDFVLQFDTTVAIVDRGSPNFPPSDPDAASVHYGVHPMVKWQEQLRVSQETWGKVLSVWDRGVGIPLVVALPSSLAGADQVDVVRNIKDAWEKINGADYLGSMTSSRKALEILRRLSPATSPLPKPNERDVRQRIHAIVESLFSLASAPLHTDPVVNNFVPERTHAITAVAGAAAMAQQVFSQLAKTRPGR